MTIEDRLRDAIRAETDSIEPGVGGWEKIQMKLGNQRGRRARYLVVPAAAAIVVGVLVGVSLLDGEETTPPVFDNPPSPTPVTTTTTAPCDPALWGTEGSGFATPEELARSFAVDFLGMPNPVVKNFRQNEPHVGEIDIHPNPRVSIRTILTVQERDIGWIVTSANSPDIEIDQPTDDELVTSPLTVTGRSIVFEGQVQVAILEEVGTLVAGRRVGAGFYTGPGTEMGAFSAKFDFTRPSTRGGVLVLWTNSAEDGGVMQATVRRLRFAP